MLQVGIAFPEYRSEITPQRHATLAYGAPGQQEATYAFSVYFPLDYLSDSLEETIAQWHTWQYNTAGGALAYAPPDLEITVVRDSLIAYVRTASALATSQPGEATVEIVTTEKRQALQVLPKDRWIDVVVQAKWSYHLGAAYSRVSIDDVVRLEHRGPNAIRVPTNSPPYFKLGLYKWSWKSGSFGTTERRQAWFDEVFSSPGAVDIDRYRHCP